MNSKNYSFSILCSISVSQSKLLKGILYTNTDVEKSLFIGEPEDKEWIKLALLHIINLREKKPFELKPFGLKIITNDDTTDEEEIENSQIMYANQYLKMIEYYDSALEKYKKDDSLKPLIAKAFDTIITNPIQYKAYHYENCYHIKIEDIRFFLILKEEEGHFEMTSDSFIQKMEELNLFDAYRQKNRW